MHIESSNISCGVRRLVIEKGEKISGEKLASLVASNSGECAMVVAGVPARRRDITTLLVDNKFELVKDPNKKEKASEKSIDKSINADFSDFASMLMYHDLEQLDDLALSEQFVESTVNANVADMATPIMHHGNQLLGKLDFFVRFMK